LSARVEVPQARLYGAPPADMPIPDRLNIGLVALVSTTAVGLLVFAARLESRWAVLAVGVLFSYVMLTAYALLHEAAHDNLHSNPAVNHALGVTVGLLFPAPFTGVRTTHRGHHLRNRTDYEMFDLYYPTESRLLRCIQWYGTLAGLFWPMVPLAALIFALCPPLLRLPVFRRSRSSAYLLGDIRDAEVRAIRREVALAMALFTVLIWLAQGHVSWLLICYACFAFNWSTRQYIGHAFSRRDVVEGAFNLRHNAVMSGLLLHGEWDLNHHRRPDVPWLYLPRLDDAQGERPSYVRQYWRLWTGPRLCTEPAPESLAEVPLSIHP
jgi:fatty acid desaturase